ncbi:MAG: hypothetical protein K6T65_08815 [Peptococcaceae bacterium]|nr:hypothetical protein [Peptococcaceae bacterium]
MKGTRVLPFAPRPRHPLTEAMRLARSGRLAEALEAVYTSGYNAGFCDGYDEAMSEAEKYAKQLTREMEAITQKIRERIQKFMENPYLDVEKLFKL